MIQVPFKVVFKLIPKTPGKRSENLRELQDFAAEVYAAISLIPDVTIANPGGGQHIIDSSLSNYVDGAMVSPALGPFPVRVSISGFLSVDRENIAPFGTKTIISGGQTHTGSDSEPNSTILNEVKAFKTLVMNAANFSIPAHIDFEIYQIEYSGFEFGERGRHFPR